MPVRHRFRGSAVSRYQWKKARNGEWALACQSWAWKKPRIMVRKNRKISPAGKAMRMWGRHAVTAALANPERMVLKMWGTREALAELDLPPVLPITPSGPVDLAQLVPHGAPHQGLVIEALPLADRWLDEFCDPADNDRRPILVLDQVTDPQNVGAILRSAQAFDAVAVVTQDRHSPPESGTIARAASGALETMPWVRVVNLARALDQLAEAGYWRIGLAGGARETLSSALGVTRPALVLGAEGPGMRHNI
ncbi:MAG: RNA methyltransferase, partial [Sphingopyxis sp.]|nr:RNA methyltransferase [Sphingopyxis sp.]